MSRCISFSLRRTNSDAVTAAEKSKCSPGKDLATTAYAANGRQSGPE